MFLLKELYRNSLYRVSVIYLQDFRLAAFHTGDQLGKDTNNSICLSFSSSLNKRPTANNVSCVKECPGCFQELVAGWRVFLSGQVWNKPLIMSVKSIRRPGMSSTTSATVHRVNYSRCSGGAIDLRPFIFNVTSLYEKVRNILREISYGIINTTLMIIYDCSVGSFSRWQIKNTYFSSSL